MTNYRSDIKDEQWASIEKIIMESKKKKSGPPRRHSYRNILNGIFYVTRTGIAWCDLPEGFPPYRRVHDQYMKWIRNGVFDKILTELRQTYRMLEGKDEEPTCAIIDSKTVQTVFNHETIGVDGHKKNQGH
jgi:transposase